MNANDEMNPILDDDPPAAPHRVAAFLVAVLCLGLIGLIDYYTGPDIASVLFYVGAVAFVAWMTADLRLTLAAAVLAALIWVAAERTTVMSAHAVLLWNAVSRLAIFCGVGYLIWRLKRALDVAQSLARTDYLTDLLNARAFHQIARLEISRARRYGRPLTVAYFDLDDFKSVNDRYGHARGDVVLRAAGQTLKSSLRETDTVARVGGDEFVVLLPETDQRQTREVLEKLQQALADTMKGIGNDVTVSIGAAVFEMPPADVDALIRAADAMMYKAKAEGKNRFRISVEKPALTPERTWRSPPASG